MARPQIIRAWRGYQVRLSSIALAFALGAGVATATLGWQFAVLLITALALGTLVLAGPATLLIALICAGPFAVGRTVSIGGLPDVTLERVLVFAALCSFVLHWLGDRRRLFLASEDVLLLLFVGFALVTMLVWRTSPLSSELQLFGVYVVPLIAYFIGKHVFDSPQALQTLLIAAIVLVVLLSIVTPFEFRSGTSVLGQRSEIVAGAVRVQSFLRSAWEFGTIDCMLIALCIPSLRRSANRYQRRLAAIAIALGSVGVILCFMRANWLGLLVALSVLIWQYRRLRRPTAFIIFVCSLAVVPYLGKIVQSELWIGRIAEQDNLTGRLLVATQLWRLFLRNPLWGSGMGWLTTTSFAFSRGTASSHNTYLGHLASFGILGSLYFVAILLILRKSLASYGRLPKNELIGKELVAGLLAAAIALLIEAATSDVRFFVFTNVLFWLILAVLSGVNRVVDLRLHEQRSRVDSISAGD